MESIHKGFLALLFMSCVAHIAFGIAPRSCYSSNGGSRNADDPGKQVECREVAGHTTRFCRKFKIDSHPGKVFRECDHVYEQLFGYDSFDHGKIEVCKEFETTVMGKMEKGVHCACLGDNCNTGPVQLPPP